MEPQRVNGMIANNKRLSGLRELRALWSARLTALLVASILLLIAVGFWASRSLATLEEGNGWALHTESVRLEIGQALQYLTDVETGARGFAVSADKQFLQPYSTALPQLSAVISRLKQLVADDPGQRSNVERLASLVQARTEQAREVIGLVEQGDVTAARALIAAGAGMRTMDAARAMAAQMQAEETRLRELRRAASDSALHNSRVALWVSSGVAILLLLAFALSAMRHGIRVRRGETTLTTTLRSVGDAVISTDANGAVQFMNSIAEELTGWNEQSARGRSLDEVFRIFNEETRAAVESPVAKVLREGAVVRLANHTVLIARDGTERAIEDSGAPIVDAAELIGVVLVFRDATAQRANQRALLESERRYRTAAREFTDLADNVNQLVWMAEPDGSIFWYNKRWYEYTGTTFEAMQGWGWQEVHDPNELPAVLDRWRGAITRGERFEMVFPLKGADGEFRPFLTRVVPITNDDGKVTRWFGTNTDISEQLRAEELTREREEQLRLATEAAEIGLWDVNMVRDTLFWPPRVKAMFGISPQVPVSMADFYAGLHPEDRAHTSEAFAAAVDPDGRALYDVEYRTVGKEDGVIRWVAAKGRGIFNNAGRCVRVIGTAIDITERRRVVAALGASQHRSREIQAILVAALASTSDAVFIGDENGRLVHYNKAFATYHRFKSEQECSKHISDWPNLLEAFLADGSPAALEMWALPRALRGETATNVEYALRRRDSGESWMGSYSFGPIRAADGSITGAVVVARDITEAKQAGQALRARERVLRLATAAAKIGVFEWNIDTGENSWSPELESMYGLDTGRFGKTQVNWEQLIHPADRAGAVAKVQEALQSGQPVEHEWRVVWPDGSVHWIFGRFQTVIDQGSKPLRLTGVNFEITARKQSEVALQAADRHKDEFLAMLAHELRNPLAAISTASELLARTLPGDTRSQTAAGMMKRQVRQLTRLVDDLLDVARITQGRIELKMGAVDLAAVVQQAVETIGPQLREKRHRLSVTASSYEPLYVRGDFTRLVQCVGNILMNAVKFTAPAGQISLRTGVEENNVFIEVSDTGVGIPAELLPRVFDLFVQSERTLDRSQGGLGIGLAVVKRLIQMHDGEVYASSTGVGQGSTFEIRMGRIAEPVVEAAEGPAFKANPRRILIVDDNADAANTLAMLLNLQGHETQVAYSAKEALACSEGFRPDIGLLDIGLPEISGYELAKQLRAMPQFQRLHLVAVTGYGQAEDRQRALSAGFNDHLVKPVEMVALERTLAGLPGATATPEI